MVCVSGRMMGYLFLQIIDARITEYELNKHPSQVYFTGKIYFKDGKEQDVRFFQFKKSEGDVAKQIFSQTSKIHHQGVLKAYFAVYNEWQESWILCYDWFDHLLDEIMDNQILKKETIDDNSHSLSIWWKDAIWYNIILMSFNFNFFLIINYVSFCN